MPITELLTRHATYFKDDIALVEINPEVKNIPHVTWREYSLIESNRSGAFRKQLTWGEFDVKANQFANLLLTRGIKKGDKVAILLMNCIDWLPIYFGILKTGALAVPLNFRYTADEIEYCLKQSDSDALVFGPEFIGRVPIDVSLDLLTEDDLVRILTEPKNALVKQYQALFALDNVKLTFEDDAIREIAKKSLERKTGARGLRAIMETVMMDYMYDVPSEDVDELVITKEIVDKHLILESRKEDKVISLEDKKKAKESA